MTPRRDIDEFQRQIEELFDDLWKIPRFAGLRHGFRPQVDCYRTDDPPQLHVVVELPGVDPEQVRIVVSGRVLLIAGVRERPHIENVRVQQMELEYGGFQRRIQLADDVDSAAATATYDRGLLEIVLPLAAKPRAQERVPIEVRRAG